MRFHVAEGGAGVQALPNGFVFQNGYDAHPPGGDGDVAVVLDLDEHGVVSPRTAAARSPAPAEAREARSGRSALPKGSRRPGR